MKPHNATVASYFLPVRMDDPVHRRGGGREQGRSRRERYRRVGKEGEVGESEEETGGIPNFRRFSFSSLNMQKWFFRFSPQKS